MRDLTMRALDTAKQRGAGYADVRVVRFKSDRSPCATRTSRRWRSDESLGFGVRVIVDGSWGFAASHTHDAGGGRPRRGRGRARREGRRRVRGPRADIGPPQSASGTYRTPVARDPFAVSLDDKIALLLDANATMMRVPEHRLRRGQRVLPARGQAVRQQRGRVHRAGAVRDRLRHRGDGRRRGRGAEPLATPTASGGTRAPRGGSSSSATTCAATRSAWPRRLGAAAREDAWRRARRR